MSNKLEVWDYSFDDNFELAKAGLKCDSCDKFFDVVLVPVEIVPIEDV